MLEQLIALATLYTTDPLRFCDEPPTVSEDGYVRMEMRPFRSLISEHFGIHSLGSGNFSRVFPLDDERVLKLNCVNTGDGYPRFVEFVRQYPKSKHLPRIYETGMAGTWAFYVLERLEEISYSHHAGEFVQAITSRNQYMSVKDPEIEALRTALQEARLMNDVAERNIMLRTSTNDFVITDPCAYA